MMLRPFTNQTDELVYTNDVADEFFPVVPQGSARSCIVGVTFEPVALGRSDKTLTRMAALDVGGRRYLTNQAVPLALFDGTTNRNNDNEGISQYFTRGTFPGNKIELPWGGYCSAIPYGPGETIRIRLERDNGSNGVRRAIVHCLQFPDNPRDPLNNLYDDLRRGIGEASFIGHQITWGAPGSVVELEGIPQPPSGTVVRRTECRGIVVDSADGTIQETGAVAATTLNNLLVQLSTSFNRAPQSAPAPARSLLGLPGWQPWGIGAVDLKQSERSRVNVSFNGTAAADPTVTVAILQMLQGRPTDQAELLQAANAVS